MEYYRKALGATLHRHEDGFVIIKQNMVFQVNETAARIFELCNGKDSETDIIRKVSGFYHSSIEETERGIQGFLDKMQELSCECILEALTLIEAGNAPREVQNHDEATYAPMLTKEDGLINWADSGIKIANQVRALDPWPGTFTYYNDQVHKIWECKPIEMPSEAIPGTVLEANKHLLVKTGDGALLISSLQGQGSKKMNAADYLRGRSIEAGAVLCTPENKQEPSM